MVLLEIATLIMAGVGLADYYHTKIYRTHLNELKRKYGEHPNIDEAFEDICTLGGEYFKMPELILDEKYPRIDMGAHYSFNAEGPLTVLDEFFITIHERVYFHKKFEKEVRRQAKLRHNTLRKMYDEILVLYKDGKLDNMGSTRMTNRRFETPPMFAWDEIRFNQVLNDICENTIWGELIEAGPITNGYNYEYISEWYIKEEAFNKIKNVEVYRLLFECCYFHSKFLFT